MTPAKQNVFWVSISHYSVNIMTAMTTLRMWSHLTQFKNVLALTVPWRLPIGGCCCLRFPLSPLAVWWCSWLTFPKFPWSWLYPLPSLLCSSPVWISGAAVSQFASLGYPASSSIHPAGGLGEGNWIRHPVRWVREGNSICLFLTKTGWRDMSSSFACHRVKRSWRPHTKWLQLGCPNI